MQRIKLLLKTLVIIFVLMFVALIIYGKIHSNNNPNVYLYMYGILVTTTVFFTFSISSFMYKDLYEEIRKKNIQKDVKRPFISCILAVYNEEFVIRKCVDSLINSTYQEKEIIVVNDCSKDRTREILQEYGSRIKVINLPKNIGKKKAIAEGIKISKGNIFVFTDSDTIVEKDAIEKCVEIFMNYPNVGSVSGHVGVMNAQENFLTKIQDSWYETQFSVKKATESAYGAVSCVSGPLALFRKEAIYNYIPAWQNDTFLGQEFRFATDRQLTGYVLGQKYIGKDLKKKYADSPFVKEIDYEPKEWKVVYCKSAKSLYCCSKHIK